MILVDTCVWSLALRRNRADLSLPERALRFTLRDLIIAGKADIIGPIHQEILSGIADPTQFDNIKYQLTGIPDLPLDNTIWHLAAEFFNACRSKGTAPDAIDMTICAAAHIHNTPIFTTDPDFPRYAKYLPIPLFRS